MPSEFHGQLTTLLPQLRSYAMFLTRDRSGGDDLLQETAYRALRAQSQFTLGTNFKAWMYRIMRNEFIGTCRRTKRPLASLEDVPEFFLARDSEQENKVFTSEILKAMDSMHPDHREILMLYCVNGMNYEEIRLMLGCSIGTVKSRLWRARHHMRTTILGETEDTDASKVSGDSPFDVGRSIKNRALSAVQAAKALAFLTPDTGREFG